MKNQKEDIVNYFGTILVVVSFFFFISIFSSNSNNLSPDSLQYSLKTDLHLNQVKAVNIDNIELPTFNKSIVLILFNAYNNLSNNYYKIQTDNNKIAHQIVLLQKVQLKIKPNLICRFIFNHFPISSEDLPILS